MLNFTRKSDYALVALAKLAEGAKAGQPSLSAREIAEAYNLPLPLMMNVLKRLHRAGLIGSTRGVHGGYFLNEEPEHLRLAAVIEAIEGPLQVAVCCQSSSGAEAEQRTCRVTPVCPITGSIRRLNLQIRDLVNRYTLADLLAGLPDGAGFVAETDLVVSQSRTRATP
ncbi:MAG: Rrf2 family transcriptional regulator [Phycisphaeraceae bacterium]|nr:Rrf2 family transcriptional regulator [Phycisphaeraceae bacterium]